jgi:hypothetical protein
VPVAVVAAIGEQYVRSSAAEIVESIEQRLTEVGVGRGASTVQEYEQLTAMPASRGHNEYLVQISVNEWAVDREAGDRCASGARIAPSPVAGAEPRHAGDEDNEAER